MAKRKYFVVNKAGVISDRPMGRPTPRKGFSKVGQIKGRNVYAKRDGSFKSRKYKLSRTRPISPVVRELPHERQRGLVEVKGLVSVSYESKRKSFHAEMLFFWYGPVGFDEQKLLDNAVQVLIDTLPEIERIPFELAFQVSADFDRRGIESVNPYSSQRENEMDFEIYIPRAGYGRALLVGNARVVA